MRWNDLSDLHKNTLIAEKIFGWQWIFYNFYDVSSIKNQLWLLPDGESVANLKPGEWTWYLEEEKVYPEGSYFPLPHKDNRILAPGMMPNYIECVETALQVAEKAQERFAHAFLTIRSNVIGEYKYSVIFSWSISAEFMVLKGIQDDCNLDDLAVTICYVVAQALGLVDLENE